VVLTQKEFQATNTSAVSADLQQRLKMSGNEFGGWHSINTSCTQVSKRLVTYIEAIIVLSPYVLMSLFCHSDTAQNSDSEKQKIKLELS
jgi:hypothetical protein